MAVKRSFSVKNKSQCVCLKCGAQILPDDLKDNTVYKCTKCGQEMTVDRYESRAVLTVIEKPDLRRRVPPEIMNADAGSGACLRAAYRTGHDFLGFEIEKDYFTKADERLRDEMAQMRFDFLFGGGIRKHRRKRRGSRRHKIKRTLKIEKRKTKNDRFGSGNPKRSSRTQLKLKPSNSIRRVR